MSINRYKPHLLVVPEDDACRMLALGFGKCINKRTMQILPAKNGWQSVLEWIKNEGCRTIRQFPQTRVVLVIDFDEQSNRFSYVQNEIPSDVRDRVFVLGVWSNPEDLKNQRRLSLEDIGFGLATDCANGTSILWNHELLARNQPELQRMISDVNPFLF